MRLRKLINNLYVGLGKGLCNRILRNTMRWHRSSPQLPHPLLKPSWSSLFLFPCLIWNLSFLLVVIDVSLTGAWTSNLMDFFYFFACDPVIGPSSTINGSLSLQALVLCISSFLVEHAKRANVNKYSCKIHMPRCSNHKFYSLYWTSSYIILQK